jgi:hypothetical protein
MAAAHTSPGRQFAIVAVAFVVFLAAGFGLAAVMRHIDVRTPRAISGTIEVRDDNPIYQMTEKKKGKDGKLRVQPKVCVGTRQFNDMKSKTPVVVTDQNGKTVGTDALTDGLPGLESAQRRGYSNDCVFAFVVDVGDAKSYTVTVANRRGATVSKAEMQADNWFQTLTLGPDSTTQSTVIVPDPTTVSTDTIATTPSATAIETTTTTGPPVMNLGYAEIGQQLTVAVGTVLNLSWPQQTYPDGTPIHWHSPQIYSANALSPLALDTASGDGATQVTGTIRVIGTGTARIVVGEKDVPCGNGTGCGAAPGWSVLIVAN